MKRLFLNFLILITLTFHCDLFSQSFIVNTIVIDPGHGGKDPGNLGTGRYKETEKDITLSVALKLGNLLKENIPTINIVYTREDDSYPTLLDRANLANSVEADLFISIHCDAFKSKSAYGSSSFVMGLDYTDENLRMAQKENSSIYLEENYEENYEGFDPQSIESIIALTLNQSVYMNQSILIAQKIQEQFKNRVKRKDRGVRQAPYFVTSRTLMPSVLVELGFLTNPDEEDFLRSKIGQSYMASAIYRAIKEYNKDLIKNSSNNVKNSILENEKKQNNDFRKINYPIFKVQILSSNEKKKINSINGYDVSYHIDGNLYKFTIGNENDFESALKLQNLAQKNGFNDAFIIAFFNNEKISIDEANKIIDNE